MKITPKISIFSLIDLALTCYMAYIFLSLWLRPQASDVETIYNFSVLMAFEFIMVHSGVFMSVLGRSWKGWLFFILIYGLFAFVFNLFVTDNRILFLYGGVVLSRMLSGIMTSDETEKAQKANYSVVYVLIYFFLIFFVAMHSFLIPEFGLTDDFLESSGYRDNIIIGGLFTDTPYTAMCFGALYYTALSLVALFAMFYQPAEKPAPEVNSSDEDKPYFYPQTGLGFGIASILLSWFVVLGTILAVFGLVASILTIKQYRETPEEYTRKSYIIARIGKICSIIGLIASILSIFVMMFVFW